MGSRKVSREKAAAAAPAGLLASFFPAFGPMTIAEVMKKAGYSYERVHTFLAEFGRNGMLLDSPVGRAHRFQPNPEKRLAWYGAFMEYQLGRLVQFSAKYPTAAQALRELASLLNARTIVIFGSYARLQAREESDLDILCISRKKERDVARLALSLMHRYGLAINAIPLSIAEFRKIKDENPALHSDLRENGIVLNDPSLFFEIMYCGG